MREAGHPNHRPSIASSIQSGRLDKGGDGRPWCMMQIVNNRTGSAIRQGKVGRGSHVAFSLIQEDKSSRLEAYVQHILSTRHIR